MFLVARRGPAESRVSQGMVEGDVFREVEEELRRERLKALWDRYGALFMAAALAIVLGVAGYKGWQYWTAYQAAAAGSKYDSAVKLVEEGKTDEATQALETMTVSGPSGYRGLARFRLAAQKAKAGKKAEAAQLYDDLAGDSSIDGVLQSFARIRSAMLNLDTADFTEIKNRLNDLTGADSPWRHSARELMGLAAYKAGKTQEAQGLFNQILGDPVTPQGLRQRAQMMMSLIVDSQGTRTGSEKPGEKSGAPTEQTN